MTSEVFDILQEECAEVIQAVSKIRRFGIDTEHNGITNREHLTTEVGDLQCMINLLIEFGYIDLGEMQVCADMKRHKLQQWSNIFKENNNEVL